MQSTPDHLRILREIEARLAEPLPHVYRREATAFDQQRACTDGTVVLYGAGRLGRLCLRMLADVGVRVVALCDRNEGVHGALIEGVLVLRPEEAAARFGADSLFLITIWTGTARESMVARESYLRRLGCAHVAAYPAAFWAHGASVTPFHSFDLPSRVMAHASALRHLARRLSDEGSVLALKAMLDQRLLGIFSMNTGCGDQYFPSDIIRLGAEERVLDAGAYTGDTLDDFLRRVKGEFDSYCAVEPDPQTVRALRWRIAALPGMLRDKIEVHAVALSDQTGEVYFNSQSSPASSALTGGTSVVSGSTIDEIIGARSISFLKMDIEGSERAALAGAAVTLARCQPAVAICVYHQSSDLWELSERLAELLPRHRYYLRTHGIDGWETVLYAVPPTC